MAARNGIVGTCQKQLDAFNTITRDMPGGGSPSPLVMRLLTPLEIDLVSGGDSGYCSTVGGGGYDMGGGSFSQHGGSFGQSGGSYGMDCG